VKRSLALLLATACGRDGDTEAADASTHLDAPVADAPLADLDASHDAGTDALDGECPLAVGGTVIDHACLHVTHGPRASVTASGDPDTATANVNMPHTLYTIDLVPDSSQYRGVVTYRPTQDGDHAFFVDPAGSLVVTDRAGAALPVVASHDVTTCDGVASVAVVRLAAQTRYHLAIPAVSAPSLQVIIENLDGFAPEDAWTRACPGS
jgi:hypothetical protein